MVKRSSFVILLISVVLVKLCTAQDPTQGFFDGKCPLFNLGNGPNTAVNANGGAVATVDVSTASALTIEFWHATSPFRFGTNLTDGATFFLGNENSYIRFSSYNGVPENQPLTYCFHLVIFINGVQVATATDNTAGGCILNPDLWYHVSIGLSTASSYVNIRSFDYQSFGTFGTPSLNEFPLNFPGDFTTFTGSKFITGGYPSNFNITPKNGFGGRIDEVRIWSEYRAPTVIADYYTTSLTGKEANLVAYYNFDDNSVANTFFDLTPNARNGVFFPNSTGQYPQIVEHQWDYYANPQAYSGCCLPLMNEVRSMQSTGTLPISTCTIDYSNSGSIAVLIQSPANGKVCVGSVTDPTCDALTLNNAANTTDNCVPFTYIPGRDACNTSQTIAFTMKATDPSRVADKNTIVKVSVDFSGAQMNNQTYNVATSGGALTLTGTNFGVAGPLTAFEWVRINTNYGTYNCTEPTVTATGDLQCNVPSGVGYGTISVGLCRQALSVTPTFAYKAPTVSYASVNATSTELSNSSIAIIIYGENFGNNRDLNVDTLTRVSLNNVTCDIYYIDDNNIRCTILYRINSGSSVPLNVTIGGQTIIYPFVYTLCGPPCANGGKCIGYQTCDCKYTGFGGVTCEDELQCSPSCKNGAQCKESSLNGNYALVCDCPSGYTGADCGQKNSNTAIIVGSVVGGGGALAILAAAIVFFFFRKPARGTKNFIPLEKKDFTKIIYGDQLNSQPEKTTAHLDELEKLLVEDDLKLAFAVNEVTQITEADKIAKAMVIIFQDNRKVLGLLQSFIDEEVKTTESAGTLFRSNSMASKMFKFYSRLIGLPYLYVTVGPEIDELIAANLGLEVDPEKMEEGTDLDEMRWMLMAQSQKILKFILASADVCPVQFRTLFGHIKHVVAGRFPENVNTTIGGFIFLRFFCPAISSPEAYGILEEPPSASARRLLILITKVLQNLSNDVEFGSKEPYMAKMNDFIQSNRVKLANFYEQLVKSGTKEDTEVQLPPNMKKIQLTVIANHIRTCIDQIKDQDLKKRLETIV